MSLFKPKGDLPVAKKNRRDGPRRDMKIILLLMIGFFATQATDAGCQAPLPSGPGDTLKRSQDTMEYYQLEREMQKNKERLKEKTTNPNEKPGNQKEIEINDEDNQVIRYRDEKQSENE